ncbi:TetR/AcrR family transcriptional regulator [uncultured Mailhella sp.]|uniref:TetR/AcrR family transcriptional regulator n=1 Tax=uncultured Mailhella sp. TaxID=1981031 RepID=UPI00320921C1
MDNKKEIKPDCYIQKQQNQEVSGQKRNASRTKARILESAERLFTKNPYDNVTMRQIASMAGVDPSLIIRYFSSKEELFSAVLDNISSRREFFYDEDADKDFIIRTLKILSNHNNIDNNYILNIIMLSSQSNKAKEIIKKRTKLIFDNLKRENINNTLAYISVSCAIGSILINSILEEENSECIPIEDIQKALKKIFDLSQSMD